MLAPAVVHWSIDDWKNARDVKNSDTGLGIHIVDIPSAGLSSGTNILFTFNWIDSDQWEEENFAVTVAK